MKFLEYVVWVLFGGVIGGLIFLVLNTTPAKFTFKNDLIGCCAIPTKDRCPGEPEDLDGFKDNDGCPDYDNDNDGISDGADVCPNISEDDYTTTPLDGCPAKL